MLTLYHQRRSEIAKGGGSMKIIYPPLIEDGYAYFKQQTPKAQIYQTMIQQGIIDETGAPAIEALQKDLVKDFDEAENLLFDEFLELYPIFKVLSDLSFKQIEGFWEIPLMAKEQLLALYPELNYDHKQQLDMYFLERGGLQHASDDHFGM